MPKGLTHSRERHACSRLLLLLLFLNSLGHKFQSQPQEAPRIPSSSDFMENYVLRPISEAPGS